MRRWVNAASVRSSVRPSPDKEPVGIYVGIDRHRYERTSLELVGQDLVGEALTVDRVGRVVSPRTCRRFEPTFYLKRTGQARCILNRRQVQSEYEDRRTPAFIAADEPMAAGESIAVTGEF